MRQFQSPKGHKSVFHCNLLMITEGQIPDLQESEVIVQHHADRK